MKLTCLSIDCPERTGGECTAAADMQAIIVAHDAPNGVLNVTQMVNKPSEISDGYHTFDELYEFRKLYNAALFNMMVGDAGYAVHKSRFHSDGEPCFGGGWFIVVAYLPTGQISNHYEEKDWDLFHCEERIRADEWDGHTPADVVQRLTDWLKNDFRG